MKKLESETLISSVRACVSDIEVADFVALDLEFSGLFLNPEREKSPLSLESYFAKCIESIPRFLPLQLGLCCGRWREADGGFWELRSHEFNLWPDKQRIFTADMQSLRFLRQHGFDFNAFFELAHSYSRLPQATDGKPATSKKIDPRHATNVLSALRDSRLPLIFHNGLLDLLHLHDKFVGDLPSDHAAFGKAWLQNFPLMYDTRLIAQEGQNQIFRLSSRLTLEELHRHFTSSAPGGAPCLRIEKSGPVGSDRSAHGSAGKDAQLTAEVFLMEMDLWLRSETPKQPQASPPSSAHAVPQQPKENSVSAHVPEGTPAAASMDSVEKSVLEAVAATTNEDEVEKSCDKRKAADDDDGWTAVVPRRKRQRNLDTPSRSAALIEPELLQNHALFRRFQNRIAIMGASPGSLTLGPPVGLCSDATTAEQTS